MRYGQKLLGQFKTNKCQMKRDIANYQMIYSNTDAKT